MTGILAHPRTVQEARLIEDLFDKMNIPYEKNVKLSVEQLPNATTRKAINDARKGKGEKFDNLADLFEELKR